VPIVFFGLPPDTLAKRIDVHVVQLGGGRNHGGARLPLAQKSDGTAQN